MKPKFPTLLCLLWACKNGSLTFRKKGHLAHHRLTSALSAEFSLGSNHERNFEISQNTLQSQTVKDSSEPFSGKITELVPLKSLPKHSSKGNTNNKGY